MSRRPQLQQQLIDSIVQAPELQRAREAAKQAGLSSAEAYQFLTLADTLRFDLVTKARRTRAPARLVG